MSIPRAEIGREIPKNQQYLKAREQAFVELLEIFTNITAGNEFVLRLPAATKKYSQFLSVSDREPLIKAVDDWILHFLNPPFKKEDWARILSVVMSSGVNRCDVDSPGLSEVARLIPLSPFKDAEIVANVSAHTIISPNEILQPGSHHEHYLRARRVVYKTIFDTMLKFFEDASDLSMGAEYFVAGRFMWVHGYPHHLGAHYSRYITQVVKPIDRRGG